MVGDPVAGPAEAVLADQPRQPDGQLRRPARNDTAELQLLRIDQIEKHLRVDAARIASGQSGRDRKFLIVTAVPASLEIIRERALFEKTEQIDTLHFRASTAGNGSELKAASETSTGSAAPASIS